ncbi:MAG: alpha/beta hydrolase [Marinilabiliales bacterium]|nr:MAG: alpha/beta hydrolase [Marinilabiliales bacterium]
MRKRIIRVSLYIIGGISATVLGLFVALWIISPGKPEPLTGPDGNPLEGSISVIEKISLGGLDQYLIIRGADSTKPVMLFLHGGPGSPEAAFMKHFNPGIEKDFVMVYWEQRGAGKSWSRDIPVESMNMRQFISDTRELSEYLSERFKQDRIYIMGHSWGSLLGILAAREHPELYRAYFGIGQVADQFIGEQISFEWAKEEARNHNDKKAAETLAGLSFPDLNASGKEWIDYMTEQRIYVNKFGGGTTRDITGMWPLIRIVFKTRDYTIGDKLNFMNGSMFSLEHMWNEVIQTNLFNEIDSMQVPVYIFHGKYDFTTPYSVAKDFYDQLKAPEKGFFTFENSAHSPVFEEVEKFNSIVREITQKY